MRVFRFFCLYLFLILFSFQCTVDGCKCQGCCICATMDKLCWKWNSASIMHMGLPLSGNYPVQQTGKAKGKSHCRGALWMFVAYWQIFSHKDWNTLHSLPRWIMLPDMMDMLLMLITKYMKPNYFCCSLKLHKCEVILDLLMGASEAFLW